MSLSLNDVVLSVLDDIATRRLALVRAATWTVLLTVTVAVASVAPEMAFVTAISASSSSSFAKPCNDKGYVRIPLNDPTEVLCFPAHTVRRSEFDFFVPTVFAALVVAGSACLVLSLTY